MADKWGSTDHHIELDPSTKEIRKSIRNAGNEIRKGVRLKLKEVGQIVAVEAQGLARAKGLVGKSRYGKYANKKRPGRLIKSIKPSATGTSVKVRATAKTKSRGYPAGYNYPKRYEFQKGGVRAFMRPALAKKKEQVLARFRAVLEDAGKEFSKS